MKKPAAARVPVVGIGASAGGVEAFQTFFENMPADSGLAIVVVLHLPRDRMSLLPSILARWTRMPVVVATDGLAVKPNHVYLPPPGAALTLTSHGWRLPEMEPHRVNLVTTLFNSLAAQLGPDAIGVVLSGTGHDGSLGLKAIRENGGFTLAQGVDGTKPLHEGMPANAIAIGVVDLIAPVQAMPAHIVAYQQARRDQLPAMKMSPAQIDSARRAICTILLRQLDHDFSGYKDNTFLRRVQRRMQITRLLNMDGYIRLLESSHEEVVMLFRDLLIGVTSFFRDNAIFEALERVAIPRLFQGKAEADTVRVWVPGCSTGEEAYSIAMLLCEHADGLQNPPSLQIFATDIDDAAVATARAGRYPSTLLQGMSAPRLARFFSEGPDGSFTVSKALRKICTFAPHSLVRDPPYSRIDFISCRNLLIYLDTDTQTSVIPAFHYALVKDGILLLGSSETLARREGLFSALDRAHRIFQRRDAATPLLLARKPAPEIFRPPGGSLPLNTGSHLAALAKVGSWASARVREQFAPAFVVVSADGTCLRYSHRINRFLEIQPGAPNQNVLAMARRGLRGALRAALNQAAVEGRLVEAPPVALAIPGAGRRAVVLTVEPHREAEATTHYLVVFTEMPLPGGRGTAAEPESGDRYDTQAESELRETREMLRTTTEEYGTAVEELRIANEELHSMNEEFQSTNEELETSKEEIQSINEELNTVNSQLAQKIDELDTKNTDLVNLFASTKVATLFLDRNLVVRNFTPAMTDIYNLIPGDQGRPIADIVSRLRYDSLLKDVAQVLDTLEPVERSVARNDGKVHYLMRILPYCSHDHNGDGVTVTFVEATSIVEAEQHLRLLVDELNHRVKNMLTVVISLAMQTLRRSDSLEAFSRTFMGRLHALTNAYSLLSAESWQTVSIRELATEELRPFISRDPPNVTLAGPSVRLAPRAALTLGMALHELTTNAVKYGALSVDGGSVRVAWRVEPTEDEELLYLEWIETDGPLVAEPAHRGFGSTLIERGLRQDMSATVNVDFDADGVKVRIRAPLGATAGVAAGDGG